MSPWVPMAGAVLDHFEGRAWGLCALRRGGGLQRRISRVRCNGKTLNAIVYN